jgi:hypothetical protein
MRLGVLDDIEWEAGDFAYEAVAEPTVIRREKQPSVFR